VVGSHDLYEHPHINDLAYMPAASAADGKTLGFNLLVGGFFSNKRCAEAIPWGPGCQLATWWRRARLSWRRSGTWGSRGTARRQG